MDIYTTRLRRAALALALSALLAAQGGWVTGALAQDTADESTDEVTLQDEPTEETGAEAEATPAATFAEGDEVVVDTDGLNLREEAGLDADVIVVLGEGEALTITGAGQTADGSTWYPVLTGDELEGWVAGEFLAAAGAATGFTVGDVVAVDTDALNLRDDASLDGEVLDVLSTGETMVVIGEPVEGDEYTWYEVEVSAELTGFVAGDFLAVVEDLDLVAGDSAVVATDVLNVRSEANLDAEIVATLVTDDEVTILDGPVDADGYSWFEVSDGDASLGWVAGEFLTEA